MRREVPSSPAVAIDPATFDAVIFDMDGVITDTARCHFVAWKRLFDEFLETAADAPGAFTHDDYAQFVDGRPRFDGISTFLASRDIELPESLVSELATRKNDYFHEALGTEPPEVFDSTVEVVHRLHQEGVRTAVVTASRNREVVLDRAGVADLFEVHVDGIDATDLSLPGKPEPAVFLEAAQRLGVDPGRAVVVEDALVGVEAASRGGFGLVIGVDRSEENADAYLDSGAHVVVADLAEIRVGGEDGSA